MRRFLTGLALLVATAAALPATAQMFDDFVLPTGSAKAPKGAPPFVIADFDAGKAALRDGTEFVVAEGSPIELRPEPKIRHLGKGQSMKVAYQLNGKAAATLRADLKGLDASRRTGLVFQVFGAREGTPSEIEIVLRSTAGEGRLRIKGISPHFWTRQALSFEKLGLKDARKLVALEFVIPAGASPGKGALYIDSIAFE